MVSVSGGKEKNTSKTHNPKKKREHAMGAPINAEQPCPVSEENNGGCLRKKKERKEREKERKKKEEREKRKEIRLPDEYLCCAFQIKL